MEKEVTNLITACRKAVDKHRDNKDKDTHDKVKKSVDEMMSAIIAEVEKYNKKTGSNLVITTLQEYAEFDKKKCFEIYKECRPIKGECDLCIGYDKDPPCKIFYKDKACIHNIKPPLDDRIYKLGFAIYTGKTTYGSCPKGHGFEPDTDNHQDLPFDVTWEVFK